MTQHVMMIIGIYYQPPTLVNVAALGCLCTTFAITQFFTSTIYEVYDIINHSIPGTLFLLLTLATEIVFVAMKNVICCICTKNCQSACVHHNITTFCDVCETANGPRLLCFTAT